MIKIPKFLLFGQDDPITEENIQPSVALRQWGDLSGENKQIALQEIDNKGWLTSRSNDFHSNEILQTIVYLNHTFLRQCPGKHLHGIKPRPGYRGGGNEDDMTKAALLDFQHIFLNETSGSMVFRMLSKFAECYIDSYSYRIATELTDPEEIKEKLTTAFEKFDALANCLNHIFEQFSVNQIITRNGFVPRQDEKIVKEIYTPTLKILADPKWKKVSDDLSKTFDDYRDEKYSEAITKAHNVVQRFLQVLVGKEGKSGKGEMSKLFKKAKEEGIIPINRFTEPIITSIQKFISSERATKSTAKPVLKDATSSDALLMMNVVMILLQYCLEEIK